MDDLIWQSIIDNEGAYGVWDRLRKLKSFRDYYQRWPTDDTEELLPHLTDFYDPSAELVLRDIEYQFELEQLLSRLSRLQRKYIVLMMDGYKAHQIAKLCHTSQGTVRFHIYVARQRLKKELCHT